MGTVWRKIIEKKIQRFREKKMGGRAEEEAGRQRRETDSGGNREPREAQARGQGRPRARDSHR